MVAKLSDDKDIGAALVGTSDASSLREILAALDAKQQALLLGHAVPMPIVVKTRTYDQQFYEEVRSLPSRDRTGESSDPDEEMEDPFY